MHPQCNRTLPVCTAFQVQARSCRTSRYQRKSGPKAGGGSFLTGKSWEKVHKEKPRTVSLVHRQGCLTPFSNRAAGNWQVHPQQHFDLDQKCSFEGNLLINPTHPIQGRSLSVKVHFFQIQLNQKAYARCGAHTIYRPAFRSDRNSSPEWKLGVSSTDVQPQQRVPARIDPRPRIKPLANLGIACGCLCSRPVLMVSTFRPEIPALRQEQTAILDKKKELLLELKLFWCRNDSGIQTTLQAGFNVLHFQKTEYWSIRNCSTPACISVGNIQPRLYSAYFS